MNFIDTVSYNKGPIVTLPVRSIVHATQQVKLSLISSLLNEASNALVLPSLQNSSPISLV